MAHSVIMNFADFLAPFALPGLEVDPHIVFLLFITAVVGIGIAHATREPMFGDSRLAATLRGGILGVILPAAALYAIAFFGATNPVPSLGDDARNTFSASAPDITVNKHDVWVGVLIDDVRVTVKVPLDSVKSVRGDGFTLVETRGTERFGLGVTAERDAPVYTLRVPKSFWDETFTED